LTVDSDPERKLGHPENSARPSTGRRRHQLVRTWLNVMNHTFGDFDQFYINFAEKSMLRLIFLPKIEQNLPIFAHVFWAKIFLNHDTNAGLCIFLSPVKM
jgi:hypothetical protein